MQAIRALRAWLQTLYERRGNSAVRKFAIGPLFAEGKLLTSLT